MRMKMKIYFKLLILYEQNYQFFLNRNYIFYLKRIIFIIKIESFFSKSIIYYPNNNNKSFYSII